MKSAIITLAILLAIIIGISIYHFQVNQYTKINGTKVRKPSKKDIEKYLADNSPIITGEDLTNIIEPQTLARIVRLNSSINK